VLFITPASNNEIAREYGASLGMLARLALGVMVGFLSAVLFAGRYSDRHGKLPTIFAGCVSMCAGLALFGVSRNFNVLIVASYLMGVGGGLSESTSMALISDLYHESKRTAMANLSQAMFGVGAVASPLLIGWLLKTGVSFRVGYVGAAGVCGTAAVIAYLALSMRQERPAGRHESGAGRRMLSDRLVLALTVGIMLYVGAEIGQSQWMAVYFERYLGSTRALAAWSLSFMWFGIMLGRITAAWASKHVSEAGIIRLCLALAAASQASLLLVGGANAGLAAAFSLGFFLGPVFPTVTSCAGGAYPERSGTVTSIVIFGGAMGAAIFPASIGWAADWVGLKLALWTCAAILVIDAAMFLLVRFSRRG
jgi:OFA family oxalate/formate antiporter-like MFS transporter